MTSEEHYRALLQAVRPEPAVTRFDYLGEGWDNVLFVIDDDRIVRFAKDARTSRMLESEASLLQVIAPVLPVSIPLPEFVARSPVSPQIALMIYRRIGGLPLDDVSLEDALIAGISTDLAHALDALHGIPSYALNAIEIPRFTPNGWVERHRTLYQQTRDDVRQGLDATEFERYEAWWRNYLTDDASLAFEPCLVHGDLASEHVLIEAEPWRLRGIIDFGDAMWADPALDLAGLPDPLARAVVARMRTVVPDQAFWTRRAMYRRIAPLHALLAGRDLGRSGLLQNGIKALRRALSV
jgi:aminoglycoside phosphotransferase (APT) family kinase protein